MREKVLVVYGGKSVEHDISIITAVQVMRHLPKEYDYIYIYIDRDGIWWTADNLQDIKIYANFTKNARKLRQVTLFLGQNTLFEVHNGKIKKQHKVSAVLNCCHGNIGEDGALQGVLKTCGIPSTSAGVTSSAICMDKAFMKDILKANDILSPTYVYFDRCAYEKSAEKIVKNIESKLKFPLVVKPANLGSSIGISVCKDRTQLVQAVKLAFEFDNKILVEEMVQNLKEFNCACFKFGRDYFTSHVNEVKNKQEIYSFEDKYLTEKGLNAENKGSVSKKIKLLTEKLYKLFDCKGVVRVDFLYDEAEKKLYVNEINSIPGSMAFYLFEDIPFKDLLGAVLKQSILDFKQEQNLIKVFDSDALKLFEKVDLALKK